MSKNYIEKINTDDSMSIKIHKDGKVCTITNPNIIKVLLNICHRNNRYFKNRSIIENIDSIIKEFDSYYRNNQRKNKKLIVMPDNKNKLLEEINLTRKSLTSRKITISRGLATTIGIVPIGSQTIIEEDIEYIEESNKQI